MQFILVILCVVLTSVFDESRGGSMKPRLDLMHFLDFKNDENYKINTPEDVRTPQQLKKHFPVPEESTVLRLKRSDNVIEEENLGTTMSWFKYTWRDSKLDDNDSKFRNINS